MKQYFLSSSRTTVIATGVLTLLIAVRGKAQEGAAVTCGEFVRCGAPTHEHAAAGRGLTCLRRFGDKIYIGYGNWDRNTGPVGVLCYCLKRELFERGPMLATEAIDQMRVMAGNLYVLEVDSTSWIVGSSHVHAFDGKNWRKTRIPYAQHIFDMTEHCGRLYVAYQHMARQQVGRHRVCVIDPERGFQADSFGQPESGRFTRMVTIGDRMVVFPVRSPASIFDGEVWADMEKDGRVGSVVTAAEAGERLCLIVCNAGKYHGIRGGATLWAMTEACVEVRKIDPPPGSVVDVKYYNGQFYVLSRSQDLCGAIGCRDREWRASIHATVDGEVWTDVAKACLDARPLSLELGSNRCFVGLDNGELWARSYLAPWPEAEHR